MSTDYRGSAPPAPPRPTEGMRRAAADRATLERILKGDNGMAVLRAIAQLSGVHGTTIARHGPIDMHRLAFNEGRRSVAFELMHLAGVPLLTGPKGDDE